MGNYSINPLIQRKVYNPFSHLLSKLKNPTSLPLLLTVHIRNLLWYILFLALFADIKFKVQNKTIHLRYYFAFYNRTISNERAVELSLAKHFLQTHSTVVEIGNVTSRYLPTYKHRIIIDKYEISPDVINIDFADIFSLNTLPYEFDLLSISTFEHFGWDEACLDPYSFQESLDLISSYLTTRVRSCMITVPLGYNPHVDDVLRNKSYPFVFAVTYFYKTTCGRWRSSDTYVNVSYDRIKKSARGIAILSYNI